LVAGVLCALLTAPYILSKPATVAPIVVEKKCECEKPKDKQVSGEHKKRHGGIRQTVIVNSPGREVAVAREENADVVQTVIINSPAVATPAAPVLQQSSVAPKMAAIIMANIVVDNGTGALAPPIQGPQLGPLVRSGMVTGSILPTRQPLKFVVDVGGKQYTGISELVRWQMDDGRVVQMAMQAKVEVDLETASAFHGVVRSWLELPGGGTVKVLTPGNNVYLSGPDELAKRAQAGQKMMFHFVLPAASSAPAVGTSRPQES
jgi:hypothetical protein